MSPIHKQVVTDDQECKRAAVFDWVRMQKISWRKGAELLGLPYREFLLLLSEHKIPLADYPDGWLAKELDTLHASSPTSQS